MGYFDGDRITDVTSGFSEYTVDQLKQLVQLTQTKTPPRKADLLKTVIHHLEGDGLKTVWESLGSLERAAVAETVHGTTTTFNRSMFRAKYGKEPNWGSGERYGPYIPSTLGFLFIYRHGDRIMPDDLRERLAKFVPVPEPARIKGLPNGLPEYFEHKSERFDSRTKTAVQNVERIPLSIREGERAVQRELSSILRLIDAGKVTVSDKTKQPTASTVRTIENVLEGGDFYPRVRSKEKAGDEDPGPIRSFAWPLLVQSAGLAEIAGTKLRLTKAGRAALANRPADTLRTIWSKFLGTTLIDELWRVENIKGQKGKGREGLVDVARRRAAIAATLKRCPTDLWISADEFLRFSIACDSGYKVARQAWHLYLGDPRYGSFGYEGCDHLIDERYLLAFLLEYAATLGILDVALVPPEDIRPNFLRVWDGDQLPFLSRYDGLIYLRVTPLGAFCLGVQSQYAPPPNEIRAVVNVLPNLEVIATGEALEESDRLALGAYALQESDMVWRLESSKLLSAIENGHSIDEIREFLIARSKNEIPATVLRLLTDVEERSRKIKNRGEARLLECADAPLAALIANDPRTRKFCLRAGESFVVVPLKSEASFKRALRDMGYLMSTESGSDEVAIRRGIGNKRVKSRMEAVEGI